MADPVLQFDKVSKIYRSGASEAYGLRSASVSFFQGEFTALVGPSGSGKSTLQHLGAGFDRASEGVVRLLDIDIASYRERDLARLRNRYIGFIFQTFNLIPVMSVIENVMYPAEIYGGPYDFAGLPRQRAELLLSMTGLAGHEGKRPHQLSGGERQRVAIARALMNNPKLIFADEPTANLDHRTGAGILDVLKKMNAELGCTVIFATHDPAVMAMAGRVIRLADGSILEEAG